MVHTEVREVSWDEFRALEQEWRDHKLQLTMVEPEDLPEELQAQVVDVVKACKGFYPPARSWVYVCTYLYRFREPVRKVDAKYYQMGRMHWETRIYVYYETANIRFGVYTPERHTTEYTIPKDRVFLCDADA